MPGNDQRDRTQAAKGNVAENLRPGKKRGRPAGVRGLPVRCASEKYDRRLAVGHFLGHVQNEFAIPFFHFAQQAAKLVEKTRIFANAAPGDVIGRLALGQIRQLWRFLAVIKELIEWALESASEFFQRFDGRDSMTILYAGNITTKQTRSFFDVALGEFLFFAECAKAVTDDHAGIIPCR